MKAFACLASTCILVTGCSTLDQSFRLGATTGTMAGAAAMFGAESALHRQPSLNDIGIAASVGLGLGLLTSYFVHQAVVEDRETATQQTEIYFGDLPPSPFVIPGFHNKKGGDQ